MNTLEPTQRTERFALAVQSALSLSDVVAVFLSAVREVIAADGIGLYQLHVGSGRVLDVHAGVDNSMLDEYEQRGRHDDPVLAHVLGDRRAFDSSQLCETRWHESGAHTVLEASGFEHSLEAPIMVDGTVTGTINFARSSEVRPFDASDRAVASLVAEHLALAIRRAQCFQQLSQRSAMFEAALDRVSDCVVLTDYDGQVQFGNRRANSDVESVEAHAQGSTYLGAKLADAVRSACSAMCADGKRVIVQDVDSAGQSLVARSVRMPDRTQAVLTTLHPRSHSVRALPIWDVLTPREQQIAEFASQGLSTRKIADTAFISENTVKQHLKRIYAKTDVSSRAELVQLIWAADRHTLESSTG